MEAIGAQWKEVAVLEEEEEGAVVERQDERQRDGPPLTAGKEKVWRQTPEDGCEQRLPHSSWEIHYRQQSEAT